MSVTPDSIRDALLRYGLERARVRAGEARAARAVQTDLDVLERLESDGPLTPKELARRFQLTSAGATVLANRLERAGWVRRRPHPTDKRSCLIELNRDSVTPKPAAVAAYDAALTSAARSVPPEHRAALLDFLGAVGDAAARTAEELRRERLQRVP